MSRVHCVYREEACVTRPPWMRRRPTTPPTGATSSATCSTATSSSSTGCPRPGRRTLSTYSGCWRRSTGSRTRGTGGRLLSFKSNLIKSSSSLPPVTGTRALSSAGSPAVSRKRRSGRCRTPPSARSPTTGTSTSSTSGTLGRSTRPTSPWSGSRWLSSCPGIR